MPNHVTHRVVVRGPAPDLDLFKDTFLALKTVTDVAGEARPIRTFDFNILVPMPDLIRDTESSSAVSDGLVVMGVPEIPDPFGGPKSLDEQIAYYLAMPWVKKAGITTYEDLRQRLLERSPDCVEKAQKALRAYEAHGHMSWYSWSIQNWGTKWNAYDVRILEHTKDRLVFYFDTAWSPPTPIFHALAERDEVLDLQFDIAGFDEGWNFAYVGTISGGYYMEHMMDATQVLHDAVYDPLSDA